MKFHVSSWKSEILHFDGLLLSKYYIKFQLKRYRRVICHYNEECTKFKEKLTCGFKYDMRNLVNFHPITQKSENFISVGSFCPKYIRWELKRYRGVIFHETEQWCKIWIYPDLVVWKMAWGIGWTFIRALKSLENCTVMDSFYPSICFS